METASLDLERQKEAKRYARLQRRMMLADLLFSILYILIWFIPGLSTTLKQTLLRITTNQLLLVALYGTIFGGVYLLLNIPISYYEGYSLPHRFNMSNQSVKDWVSEQIKGLLVSGVLGLIILEIIYALLRAAPQTWWLWVAGILLIFSVLLSNLAPVLLMPLFNKFSPLAEEHAELAERLLRLSARAGTKVQGVFQFDMSKQTNAANAALTGLGNTRRIILGDTLLSEFTPDEIETVLAHELGHQAHRDVPLLIGMQSILTLVGLYLASLGLSWGVGWAGFQGVADIAALPVFILVMGAYGLVTMPLTNTITRWRERLADEYALQLTGNNKAFASALTRLANQNLAEASPEPWVELLLYSHPSLSKRIALAETVGKK